MIGRFIRNWWWPAYVFAYPLLVWPGAPNLEASYVIRAYATVVFIVIGVGLELSDPQWRSMSMRQALTSALRRHPPIILASAFGTWVVVAAFFSPDVPIALTGALVSLGDGAVWMVAMVAVFVLVYVRTLHSPNVARGIAYAVVASGLVLVLAATVEVIRQRGFVFNVHASDLPVVTFPQKGHLSGMLALAGGAAAGLAPFAILPLLAYGIGLCVNRSAGVALLAGVLSPILVGRKAVRTVMLAVPLVVLGLIAGGLVSKATTHTTKQVASASTLASRTFYYRAAVRGIAARPVLGWGGGNFEFAWPRFLSLSELNRFGQAEWGFKDVMSAQVSDSGPPVLAIHDQNGAPRLSTVQTFKAHDQLLEAALMWGVPGALLYVALFVLALGGLRRGSPLSLGLLVYGVFLLFWFVIPETQGVLWAMAAASITEQRHRAQAPGEVFPDVLRRIARS